MYLFLFYSLYNRTTFSMEHLLKNSYCTCKHSGHSEQTPSIEDAIFEKHKQIAILHGDLSKLPTCHSVKDHKLLHICDSKNASKSYFEMSRFLFQEILIVDSELYIPTISLSGVYFHILSISYSYTAQLLKPPETMIRNS